MEKLDKLTARDFDVNETLSILKSSGSIFWSWGVSKLIAYKTTKALMIRVHGHHHNGWVFITLAWDDTYTVNLLTTHRNVVKTFEGVYFDMLVDVIDNAVEKIEDYKF